MSSIDQLLRKAKMVIRLDIAADLGIDRYELESQTEPEPAPFLDQPILSNETES